MEAGLISLQKFPIKEDSQSRCFFPHLAMVPNIRQIFKNYFGLCLNGFRNCELWILPHGMFPERLDSPSTQYWKVASLLALELCCHNTTPLGGVGVGNWWQRNTQAAAARWSREGQPQGEGARTALQRSTELQCQNHGTVVDCREPTAVTDWSAMPQIETGWLFLSRGIGPKATKRQIAAAAPYQRRISVIYSIRKGLLVMLCLSIQPHLQTDIRSPILKNEAFWWVNGTQFLSKHLFFFFPESSLHTLFMPLMA